MVKWWLLTYEVQVVVLPIVVVCQWLSSGSNSGSDNGSNNNLPSSYYDSTSTN